MEMNNPFTLNMFSAAIMLDHAAVKTAGEYIILHQISRPLIELDQQGQIIGNLAESWKIRDNFKEFHFKIRKAKWSDGTEITSLDAKRTYERQMRLNNSNHVDFDGIKKIQIINSREFIIFLKRKNIRFIRQLSYPEFGVLSEEDTKKELGKLSLKKTSGAYFLEKFKDGVVYLKKNTFFEGHTTTSPNQVKIIWDDKDALLKKVTSNQVDLFVPFSIFSMDDIDKVKETGEYDFFFPNIGYSFWININPKSPLLRDIKMRQLIQNILAPKKLNIQEEFFWKPAEQLYLSDGKGRPSRARIKDFWEDVEKRPGRTREKKNLSFLMREGFSFSKKIIDLLETANFKVNLTIAHSSKDFVEKRKDYSYDLFQGSNDFSSIDLHENIETTFNRNHALIFTDDKDAQFQKERRNALDIENSEERQSIYKDIGMRTLKKAYIAPVAYHKVIFVHKKTVDVSSWSRLFPEISLWKVKIKK